MPAVEQEGGAAGVEIPAWAAQCEGGRWCCLHLRGTVYESGIELALVKLAVLQTPLGQQVWRSHRAEQRFELLECGCSWALEEPHNGRLSKAPQ